MFLTEYYHKLILQYFISAVGEFLDSDFGFHAFGPFRKRTPHHAATPGAKVFVYITYRQFIYIYTAT